LGDLPERFREQSKWIEEKQKAVYSALRIEVLLRGRCAFARRYPLTLLLTQREADALFSMEKHYLGTDVFSYPSLGGNLRIPLYSTDKREEFFLDVVRGKIELKKNTFQNRARKTAILARIDLAGAPHRNPDGEEIPCPHLHRYREGFSDKWATPLPSCFSNSEDIQQTLREFLVFCNVHDTLLIKGDLFT
jgi:hypothetical protein